jgi:hypothetical protein
MTVKSGYLFGGPNNPGLGLSKAPTSFVTKLEAGFAVPSSTTETGTMARGQALSAQNPTQGILKERTRCQRANF